MHEAFLSDICANPDDDAPRLVYADWLDENGDEERAEFIRTQVVAVKPGLPRRQRDDLRSHARLLLMGNGGDWSEPLGDMPGVGRIRFRRGFASSCDITLDARGIEARARRILSSQPVRSLRLYDTTLPRLRAFLRCPLVSRLRGLGVCSDDPLGPGLARMLAASPHIQRLEHLDISDQDIGDAGLEILARAGKLAHLKVLNIAINAIGPPGVRALTLVATAALRELWIDSNTLGTDGARLLAACPALAGLREIHLSETEIGDSGAEALARSPHLAGLRELDLHTAGLGDDGAAALGASPHLRRLRILHLSGNDIRVGGAAALVRGEILRPVRELNLVDVPLGPHGVGLLLGSGKLGRVAELCLARNGLGPEAGALFARSHLPSLHTLSLSDNGLGDGAVRALMAAPWLGQLRSLSLDDNGLTDEAARLLAAQPALGGLVHLSLGRNGLTDEGAVALCDSPHLERLKMPWLSDNPIRRRGRARLRERFGDEANGLG